MSWGNEKSPLPLINYLCVDACYDAEAYRGYDDNDGYDVLSPTVPCLFLPTPDRRKVTHRKMRARLTIMPCLFSPTPGMAF